MLRPLFALLLVSWLDATAAFTTLPVPDSAQLPTRRALVVELGRLIRDHGGLHGNNWAITRYETRIDTLTGLKVYICPATITVGDVSALDREMMLSGRATNHGFWRDHNQPLPWFCLDFSQPTQPEAIRLVMGRNNNFSMMVGKRYARRIRANWGKVRARHSSLDVYFAVDQRARTTDYGSLYTQIAHIIAQLTGVKPQEKQRT